MSIKREHSGSAEFIYLTRTAFDISISLHEIASMSTWNNYSYRNYKLSGPSLRHKKTPQSAIWTSWRRSKHM